MGGWLSFRHPICGQVRHHRVRIGANYMTLVVNALCLEGMVRQRSFPKYISPLFAVCCCKDTVACTILPAVVCTPYDKHHLPLRIPRMLLQARSLVPQYNVIDAAQVGQNIIHPILSIVPTESYLPPTSPFPFRPDPICVVSAAARGVRQAAATRLCWVVAVAARLQDSRSHPPSHGLSISHLDPHVIPP